MMNDAEQRQEYTFIDRRIHTNGPREPIAVTNEAESDPLVGEEAIPSRPKRRLRGGAFVLSVQTVLAVLLILLALAVRGIGGETVQKFAEEYRRLTEAGALDLKALITPIAPQEDGESDAESAP